MAETTRSGDAPVSELQALVTSAAQDTPYTVRSTQKGFDVELNVADERWWEVFRRAGLQSTFRWRVTEHPSYITITDQQRNLTWSVGPKVASAALSGQTGRIFSLARGNIWAPSGDGGFAPVAGYRFDSREGRDLVRLAAKKLGIKERPPMFLTLILVGSLIGPAFFTIYWIVDLVER